MYNGALRYVAFATLDDGTCIILGCMDSASAPDIVAMACTLDDKLSLSLALAIVIVVVVV